MRAVMEATTKRIEVGRVISETFAIYGANAAPLVGGGRARPAGAPEAAPPAPPAA